MGCGTLPAECNLNHIERLKSNNLAAVAAQTANGSSWGEEEIELTNDGVPTLSQSLFAASFEKVRDLSLVRPSLGKKPLFRQGQI
jgi:hypothetical protein